MRLEVVAVLIAFLKATSVFAQEAVAAPVAEGVVAAAPGEEVVAKNNPRYNRVSSSRSQYPGHHHRKSSSSSRSTSSSGSSSSTSSSSSVARPHCGRAAVHQPHHQVETRRRCGRKSSSSSSRRVNPYTQLTRPGHPFGRRRSGGRRCHQRRSSSSSSSSSSCSSSSSSSSSSCSCSSSSSSSSSSHCRPTPPCDCPCDVALAKILANTQAIQAYFAGCPTTALPLPFSVSSIVSPFATVTGSIRGCGLAQTCCSQVFPFTAYATEFSLGLCQGDPAATIYYYNQNPTCPQNFHNGTYVVTAVETIMGQLFPYVNQIEYVWKKREGCNFWLESMTAANVSCIGAVNLISCLDPLCDVGL